MVELTNKEILSSLVADKLLTQQEAQVILQTSLRSNTSLLTTLWQQKLLTAKQLAMHFAKHMQLEFIDLNTISNRDLLLNAATEEQICRHLFLPLRCHNNLVQIACSDPETIGMLEKIIPDSKIIIKPVLVEHDKLLARLQLLFPDSQHFPLHTIIMQQLTVHPPYDYELTLADSKLDNIELSTELGNPKDTVDFPVIRYINKIILDSNAQGASDIHFEPYETHYRIRIRVDGVLHELAQPDRNLAPRLTTRLKIISGLDISERRLPQDGRFKINLAKDKEVSFRVNTCPTLFGEKIVLRLLEAKAANINLDNLGFDTIQKQLFLKNIYKNQGMILVTGPTGSGKTITLYTALGLLNTTEKNISTVEDPVEIYFPGINQVNIHSKIGLDFANVLRAFLRQDPDIIMLGEIRDQETAAIALKAAQTGHLVLATLHTNSAAETLTRLHNIGVAAFNIATSVNLVIAQRLVRRLCEHCKTVAKINPENLIRQGFSAAEMEQLIIYQPTGCHRCTGGYHGRIAIFEVLDLTPEICSLILQQGTSLDIYQQAIANGMVNLYQSGLDKVRSGITSLEEINRTVG